MPSLIPVLMLVGLSKISPNTHIAESDDLELAGMLELSTVRSRRSFSIWSSRCREKQRRIWGIWKGQNEHLVAWRRALRMADALPHFKWVQLANLGSFWRPSAAAPRMACGADATGCIHRKMGNGRSISKEKLVVPKAGDI